MKGKRKAVAKRRVKAEKREEKKESDW